MVYGAHKCLLLVEKVSSSLSSRRGSLLHTYLPAASEQHVEHSVLPGCMYPGYFLLDLPGLASC